MQCDIDEMTCDNLWKTIIIRDFRNIPNTLFTIKVTYYYDYCLS